MLVCILNAISGLTATLSVAALVFILNSLYRSWRHVNSFRNAKNTSTANGIQLPRPIETPISQPIFLPGEIYFPSYFPNYVYIYIQTIALKAFHLISFRTFS